jgi:hypothetical protein
MAMQKPLLPIITSRDVIDNGRRFLVNHEFAAKLIIRLQQSIATSRWVSK